MTFDCDIHKLTIVGSVPAGGRMGHDITGQVFVASPGFWTAAWRTFSRDGRDRTVGTVRNVLNSVDQRLTDMIDCADRSERLGDLNRRCIAVQRALQLCSHGLGNLKATYAADPSIQASLDLVIEHAAAVSEKAIELKTALYRRYPQE